MFCILVQSIRLFWFLHGIYPQYPCKKQNSGKLVTQLTGIFPALHFLQKIGPASAGPCPSLLHFRGQTDLQVHCSPRLLIVRRRWPAPGSGPPLRSMVKLFSLPYPSFVSAQKTSTQSYYYTLSGSVIPHSYKGMKRNKQYFQNNGAIMQIDEDRTWAGCTVLTSLSVPPQPAASGLWFAAPVAVNTRYGTFTR